MTYIEKRQKAPVVVLDRRNTIGYLWPENLKGPGPPRFHCYYHQKEEEDGSSIGSSGHGAGTTTPAAAIPTPTTPTAVGSKRALVDGMGSGGGTIEGKRPRPAYMPEFHYIPAKRPPPHRAHGGGSGDGKDGPAYDPSEVHVRQVSSGGSSR